MNILEIVAVIVGIISVLLTIRQNIHCWTFGLLSCILLAFFYIEHNFYGQFILQIVSSIQCIYGIINWKKIDSNIVTKIGLSKTFTIIGICILTGIAFTLLTNETNDYWLYLDRIGGVIALTATYLLVIKKIEAWSLFMINNIMLTILCVHQGIFLIALLNIILFIISIKGYSEWKKNLKMD